MLSMLNHKTKCFSSSQPNSFSQDHPILVQARFSMIRSHKIHRHRAKVSQLEKKPFQDAESHPEEAAESGSQQEFLWFCVMNVEALTHYCRSWTWSHPSWHHWRSHCHWHWWQVQICSQSWQSMGWRGLHVDGTCRRTREKMQHNEYMRYSESWVFPFSFKKKWFSKTNLTYLSWTMSYSR